jgi:hypothetical protein
MAQQIDQVGQNQVGQNQVGQNQVGQNQVGQPVQQPMQPTGTLPQQHRTALASVSQAIQVCGWCADQCVQSADPNMTECIRLCEDVVELGETVLATVPRSSRFTADIVRTFQMAAQACAQECSHHEASHCQECAAVLPDAIAATDQFVGASQGRAGSQPGPTGIPQTY